MKIVHSLWTAPWRGISHLNVRGLWCSAYHHWAGCIYSCLNAKKNYPVELVTDTLGARLLVDTFGLPYDKVTVALDNLPVNPSLWTYGKIVAYGLQEEPFFHISFDTFLFKKLPSHLESAPVLAQNFDFGAGNNTFDGYVEGSNLISNMHHEDDGWTNEVASYNTGIFGGNAIGAIQMFSQTAQRFVRNNESRINTCSELDLKVISRTIDQRMAYCCLKKSNTKIVPVIPTGKWLERDTLAKEIGYTHLMSRKSHIDMCGKLDKRLEAEFPDHHKILTKVFDRNTAKAQSPRIFAVVTVYDSPAILPHFIEHYYKLGVDKVLVQCNVPIENQKELEEKYPVVFSMSEAKIFNNDDKGRGEFFMLQAQDAKPWDWVMHLDLDEFHQYPIDVRSLTKLMENANIDAIQGMLLDRVSSDGILHKITSKPLDEQFPLQASLTQSIYGTQEKIMLAKFKVCVGGGRHVTTDGTYVRRYPVGDESEYSVHHFRWADGLLERLEARFPRIIALYPDRKYPKANIELCKRYREMGKLDLSNPNLQVMVSPKLKYQVKTPAVEAMLKMTPNPYAIDDADAAALNQFARLNNVKTVLEFGPGRSTLTWAARGIEVDALEYEAKEYERLKELFSGIQNIRLHKHDRPIAVVLPREKYDMAFVDGPSSKNYQSHTRLDSVLFALERSDTVLLHDSFRSGEQQTLEHVKGLGYSISTISTSRGIAVIKKTV